jgi:hypothetical protein
LAPAIWISYPLGNLPSIDPLVDPNTFFLIGPNQTKDLPLQIRGMNFRGPLYLRASCCATGNTGNGLTFTIIPAPPTGAIRFNAPPGPSPAAPNEVGLGTGQTGRAALRVSTPSNVARCTGKGTPCGEGTFLAQVEAYDDRGYVASTVTTKAIVVVTMMANPSESAAAGCPRNYQSTPEILPISQGVRSVFATKAASPSQTVFRIGVNTTGSARPNGWILTIAKATGAIPPLAPDESLVDLENGTLRTKSLYGVDSGNCAVRASGNLIVDGNQHGTFRISRTTTSTIVLATPSVDAVAVFSEPSFWTLFGGRRVTIRWIQD